MTRDGHPDLQMSVNLAGCQLDQTLSVMADPQATVLLADAWLAGRVARGEIHQYGRLALTTTAERSNWTRTARCAPTPAATSRRPGWCPA